jgi:hypothetical protein
MKKNGPPSWGGPVQRNSGDLGKSTQKYNAPASPATSKDKARAIGALIRLLAERTADDPMQAFAVIAEIGEILDSAGLDFDHLGRATTFGLRRTPVLP